MSLFDGFKGLAQQIQVLSNVLTDIVKILPAKLKEASKEDDK